VSHKPAMKDITRRNVDLIAKMEAALENSRTSRERLADLVALWVGSWTFLIVQTIMLTIWLSLNIAAWWKHWDPYPFILLNLVLAFQAAYAAPIILMSQNRQARLSDLRNRLDLQINLLAEQENTEQLLLLRLLCEKAGIRLDDQMAQALEERTNPDEIARQIVKSVKSKKEQQG
jgi:uncharacterized membrane protein